MVAAKFLEEKMRQRKVVPLEIFVCEVSVGYVLYSARSVSEMLEYLDNRGSSSDWDGFRIKKKSVNVIFLKKF